MRLCFALVAVLFVSACTRHSPPSPMHAVTLPSGKQIRAFEPGTTKFADNSVAYRFSYLTSLPLDVPVKPSQLPAIAAEADEIWRVIRPDVEKGGFTLARIDSQTSFGTTVPSWLPFFGPTLSNIAHGSSVTFKRARDGTWARIAPAMSPLVHIGRLEIQAAAEQGDTEALEYQFAHGGSRTLSPGDMGRALLAAEAHGHSDAVRVLLVNVSVPDASSMGYLASQNDFDSLNQIFRHDELAHDVPERSKDLVLRILIAGGSKQSDVRAQMVEWLLSHGANVNYKTDNSPITPVMLAQTPEMLQLLISHGADLEAVGPTGGLAAQFACDNRILDPVAMLKVLKTHGVDVTATAAGRWSWSPIQCAVSSHRPEVEAYLVAQGAKAPAPSQR